MNVSIQIHPARQPDGIFADKTAKLRRIVPGSIVVQIGDAVVLAARELKSNPTGGAGFHRLSIGLVGVINCLNTGAAGELQRVPQRVGHKTKRAVR